MSDAAADPPPEPLRGRGELILTPLPADPPVVPLRGPIMLMVTPRWHRLPLKQRLAPILKHLRDMAFDVDYRNPTLAELLGGEPGGD